MLLSAASFAAMGGFVKAAADVPLVEKVVARNVVTLVVAGALVLFGRHSLLGRLRNQPLLVLRSLLGVAGVTCYFYAINHLILADAAMLTKLSPFFVAIFALGFLGERPPRAVMVAMSVAFVGGLFIVKPRFDLSVLPALIGLCSSLFAGGAYTALRALRTREAAETIVFHFSLVTVVLLSPLLAIDPHLPRGGEWGELLGIGVFAAIGQIGLTLAYRYAPAAQVSIYSYTTILFSALLGFAVWAEVPDLPSLIGGVLIVAGGIGGYLADRSARPRFGREAHGGRHENDRPASG